MTGCHKNPAWMAMLAGMMPTQGDLRSSSTCARFPTDVKLRAMSISAHNFGFLVVGALQFHRWTTLTSNFIEQLTVSPAACACLLALFRARVLPGCRFSLH